MAHAFSSVSRAPRKHLPSALGPLIYPSSFSYACSEANNCGSDLWGARSTLWGPRDSLLTVSTNDSAEDEGFVGSRRDCGEHSTSTTQCVSSLSYPLCFQAAPDYPSRQQDVQGTEGNLLYRRRGSTVVSAAFVADDYSVRPLLEKTLQGEVQGCRRQPSALLQHQHLMRQQLCHNRQQWVDHPDGETQNIEHQRHRQQHQQKQQQQHQTPIPLTGTIVADRRIIFFRTQMCPHVARGQCRLGSKCRFAHRKEELRPPPRLDKTRMCAFVKAGIACTRGETCTFAHSRDELRHTTAFFKTNMCRNWLSGRCLHPETCNHAHGMQELLFFRTVATESGVRDFAREKTTTRTPLEEDQTVTETQQLQQVQPSTVSQGPLRLQAAGAGGSNSHINTSQQQQQSKQQQHHSFDALSGQLLESLMLHLQKHSGEPLLEKANDARRLQRGSGEIAPDTAAAAAASEAAAEGAASAEDAKRPRRNRTRIRGADQQQHQDVPMGFQETAARLHRKCLPRQQQNDAPVEAVCAALLQMLQVSDEGVSTNPVGKKISRLLLQQHQQQQHPLLHPSTSRLGKIHGGTGEYISSSNMSEPHRQRRVKGTLKGPQQHAEIGHWDVESTGSTETVSSTVQTFELGSRVSSKEWNAAENLAEFLGCSEWDEQRQQQHQRQ